MKHFSLAALFILAVLYSCNSHADDWTSADSTREATYLVLLATDWAQTRSFVRDGNNCKARRQAQIDQTCVRRLESNPFLGARPHQDKVDIVIIATGLAHYHFARVLSDEWRKAFQYITTGIEIGAVAHNYSVGIKARF